MSTTIITNESEAKTQLLKELSENQGEASPNESDVKIEAETEVDGHKYWKYFLGGNDSIRTRTDRWIRDDGEHFSILGCFKHNLEQVVRGEVKGPHHRAEDDSPKENES